MNFNDPLDCCAVLLSGLGCTFYTGFHERDQPWVPDPVRFSMLFGMFLRANDMEGQAIQNRRLAIARSADNDTNLVENLIELGFLLVGQAERLLWDRLRALQEANAARLCLTVALERSVGFSDRPWCFILLSQAHHILSFDEPDQGKCLDHHIQSLSLSRDAVELMAEGHPRRHLGLLRFASQSRCLFALSPEESILKQAFEAIDEAFSLRRREEEQDFSLICGAELATICARMYETTMDETYLNRGVKTCEELLRSEAGSDHAKSVPMGQCMYVLTQLLCFRSDITGRSSGFDLDRARELSRDALAGVEHLPKKHPYVREKKAQLAQILDRTGTRFHIASDRQKAFHTAVEVLETSSPTDRFWAPMINIVVKAVEAGYRPLEIETVRNLDALLKMTKKSVDAVSSETRDYFSHVGNHSRLLAVKAKMTGNIKHIDLAIQQLEPIVSPAQHDAYCLERLDRLAELLEIRYDMSKQDEDLEKTVDILMQGWNTKGAATTVRIDVAHRAAKLLIRKSEWKRASTILESAVERLAFVNPRNSRNDDKGFNLSRFNGLVSLAAFTALKARNPPEKVLEIMETGRGVILRILYQARSSLTRLRKLNCRLADRFEELRDALDAPEDVMGNAGRPADPTACQEEFDKVINEIRTGSFGLEHFPLEPICADRLLTAARLGTAIIVFPGDTHCEALVLKCGGREVMSVSLPNLQISEVVGWAEQLRAKRITRKGMYKMLEWLWNSLVWPIFSRLGSLFDLAELPPGNATKPRVWWIPVGALCSLPIHAAGVYPRNEPFSSCKQTVASRAFCSYMPSVKALLYARDNVPSNNGARPCLEPGQREVVLISVEETAHHEALPNARIEVEQLAEKFPFEGTKVLHCPSASEVRSALHAPWIFHFAGHGSSHLRNPLQSALFLKDESITTEQLLELKANASGTSPFLAYLSACSTGTTKSPKLVDEAIHMMSAFQLLGFRHVIGSLWELDDEHCVVVAQDIYDEIISSQWSDDSVSRALHQSVARLCTGKLRGSCREPADEPDDEEHSTWGNLSANDPRLWAAYVHIGL